MPHSTATTVLFPIDSQRRRRLPDDQRHITLRRGKHPLVHLHGHNRPAENGAGENQEKPSPTPRKKAFQHPDHGKDEEEDADGKYNR